MKNTPLTLCGFAASNYYNKVKLQLLEKQIAFDEKLVWSFDKSDEYLRLSPMGKVPYLLTPYGSISESSACTEFIEHQFPQIPLLPDHAYEASKARELIVYIELHLELVARVLHPQALFGAPANTSLQERQRKILDRNISAFARLLSQSESTLNPYVAGTSFTLVDCAAIVHFPLIGSVCKIIYGEDLLDQAIGYKSYMQKHSERASVRRINADRKSNMPAFMEMVKKQVAKSATP